MNPGRSQLLEWRVPLPVYAFQKNRRQARYCRAYWAHWQLPQAKRWRFEFPGTFWNVREPNWDGGTEPNRKITAYIRHASCILKREGAVKYWCVLQEISSEGSYLTLIHIICHFLVARLEFPTHLGMLLHHVFVYCFQGTAVPIRRGQSRCRLWVWLHLEECHPKPSIHHLSRLSTLS